MRCGLWIQTFYRLVIPLENYCSATPIKLLHHLRGYMLPIITLSRTRSTSPSPTSSSSSSSYHHVTLSRTRSTSPSFVDVDTHSLDAAFGDVELVTIFVDTCCQIITLSRTRSTSPSATSSSSPSSWIHLTKSEIATKRKCAKSITPNVYPGHQQVTSVTRFAFFLS